MVPFDRQYMTFYWSITVNIALSSCTVFVIWRRIICDLEIWVRGNSRSLRLVTFESLGAVFYSPSGAISILVSFARYSDLLVDKSHKFL